MTTATLNGNARAERRSLAEQIDRLDSILDGLSENLEAAVADSVRGAVVVAVTECVTEAVQVAVKEVLSNPDLLRLALAQHEPRRRSVNALLASAWGWLCGKASSALGRVKDGVANATAWCVETVRHGYRGVRATVQGATDRVKGVRAKVRLACYRLWLLRRCCTIALTVGVVFGLLCQVCGPTVASVVSGLSSALVTFGGLVLMPLWQMLKGCCREA